MSALAAPPALRVVGVTKRFGDVIANNDISLDVARGEIRAIVGENGAGKSTLMSILIGMVRPDAGEIFIDGVRARIRSPRDAMALGLGMVHQHFMLVDTLDVLDNVMLGAEGGVFLAAGRTRTRARLADLARAHGLAVDPDARVGDLPVGLRQRVEILKALARGARMLILDEPTAALTPDEANHLGALMRRLATDGVTILFITHKLNEALTFADRVSVLRAGAHVATLDVAATNARDLARAMVGRDVANALARGGAPPGRALLEARDLTSRGEDGRVRLAGVSLTLRAGEIVGVAGVAGNGQSELIEVLAGMRRFGAGALIIDGAVVAADIHDPARARALGVAHVPEDRTRRAIVREFPAAENAILGRQRDAALGRRLLDPRAIRARCLDLMERWDVRPRAPETPAGRFSGGNQQKLVFAREIEADPAIILVGQPTRGVDIGAIEAIHRRLLELRDAGKAILLVSVELDEIFALSDRILVMHEGRIVGERATATTDRREIGLLMAGVVERAA
jgi:simple sugar transport system ATP-binding protein